MYRYTRRYTSPLQAVILDLAGTCVDFGSLAPIQAFLALFESEGLTLSEAEARGPMGSEKREHIRQLLAIPRVKLSWQECHGRLPEATDVERLYQAFVPLQLEAIKSRAELIPGTLALRDYAEAEGIKLGVNTGYNREMVEVLLPYLHRQGFKPDSVVCATEVTLGRPAPHMSLRNVIELGVTAVQACVKVDDTTTGIEEGLNAGMWTVAVVASGNAVGLTEGALNALNDNERTHRLAQGARVMAQSGAHYVIDSIQELPKVLADINRQLASGHCP